MIAVLFEAEVTPASQERYLALAAELKPLLNNIDGFIAIERFQSLTTPGKILSLSWWRDEEASRRLRNDLAMVREKLGAPGAVGRVADLIIRIAEENND